MSLTQAQRDRAARGGRLAARASRGVGNCPYDANGTADQRQLALIFVRAFTKAGGTIDGVEYVTGDGPAGSSPATRTRTTRPAAGGGRHRAEDRGPYGHLGYGR